MQQWQPKKDGTLQNANIEKNGISESKRTARQ
jgi:hypothetical protein